MKLYIKQRVFSWTDSFIIKDEAGNDKYYGRCEFLSLGHKLHVEDCYGQEVIYIEQKLLTFMPKFNIFIRGREVGQLVKELTFFKQVYTVPNAGIEVRGDFFAHDYNVLQYGSSIMTLNKEWFTWGDSYVLDIPDPADELMGLAIMLAIDCAQCNANNNS